MPKKAAGSGLDVDSMIKGLIADIDAQIGQLEKKKAALVSAFGGDAAPATTPAGIRRRGRPPGSPNKKGTKAPVTTEKAGKKPRKKRVFSEETKKKLAAKAKARWAKKREEQGQE